MRVGFIGTGTMGQPMLTNIIKTGHTVSPGRGAAGPRGRAAARGGAGRLGGRVARGAEITITMLPSSSHVEAAYTGPAGVLEAAPAGRLCVDMSTIEPATSQRVAAAAKARGIRFLDAPVSGAVPRAWRARSRSWWAATRRTWRRRARPRSEWAAPSSTSPGGAGEVAKICNNLIRGRWRWSP